MAPMNTEACVEQALHNLSIPHLTPRRPENERSFQLKCKITASNFTHSQQRRTSGGGNQIVTHSLLTA